MAIYNFGSVNIDHFYTLSRLPEAGETIHATSHTIGLGGKGTNQSAAAAKAGAKTFHIGSVGRKDEWVRDRLEGFGVDCQYLRELDCDTGHAIINVDALGENTIVLDPAANHRQELDVVVGALETAKPSDTLLIQNETNLQDTVAQFASEKGLRVIYSAAPFSVESVRAVISSVSMLVMNALEASQLTEALGVPLEKVPVNQLIVTMGEKGAMWRSNETGEVIEVDAPKVTAVDTTAAGDTFIGYVAAGLDEGMTIRAAMEWGAKASALKVTRHRNRRRHSHR